MDLDRLVYEYGQDSDFKLDILTILNPLHYKVKAS